MGTLALASYYTKGITHCVSLSTSLWSGYKMSPKSTVNEEEREILQFTVILLELTKNKSKKLNKKTLSKIQKPKRKRQRTTPEQLIILEEVFNTNNTPDQQTRQKLADELGMSSRRVQIWFQNKFRTGTLTTTLLKAYLHPLAH